MHLGLTGHQKIPSITWAALSALTASAYSGRQYLVTDLGIGGSLWRSDGSVWQLVAPVVLYKIVAQQTLTGTTSETVLAQYTLPANALGSDRKLTAEAVFGTTVSANAKTNRIRHGASAGTGNALASLAAISTTGSQRVWGGVRNRTTTSQIQAHTSLSGNGGNSTSTFTTGSLDTTAATVVSFTGTLGSSGETITLEYGEVILWP